MTRPPTVRSVLLHRLLGAALTLVMAAGSSAAPPSAHRLNLSFTDDHKVVRDLSEWAGHPVVIAMAYGACRSVCSTTLRTLGEIQARADAVGLALDFVVVSIDPLEDTPQAWADYRTAHKLQRSNWTFLSGSKGATNALAGFLGVRFWNYDEHVLHDFKIVRLNPDGSIGAAVDWNHRSLDRLF